MSDDKLCQNFEDFEGFEDFEVHYISDDDEDVGEVVDITEPFWDMMDQLRCIPFDEIRKTGIFRAVQSFITVDYSYQIYVCEHEKYLEYQTIQDLMEGVSNYYQTYLPDEPRTHTLTNGLDIIRFHVELEQQIDDLAMQLSDL